MTSKASAETKLATFDLWRIVKGSEKILEGHVHRLLEDAAAHFKSNKFLDIASAMKHVVSITAIFRNDIKGALEAFGTTFEALTMQLESIFMTVVKNLQKFVPLNMAPGHAEREKVVDKVLEDTVRELSGLASRYGIGADVITTFLSALKPHVLALIVAVGDINELLPQLLPALIFSVVVLLTPQSWFLGPFLNMFGFGPVGPIQGSVAAWLQGAAAEPGTWLSLLRAAGLGGPPNLAELAVKAPALILGVLAISMGAQCPHCHEKLQPSAKL